MLLLHGVTMKVLNVIAARCNHEVTKVFRSVLVSSSAEYTIDMGE